MKRTAWVGVDIDFRLSDKLLINKLLTFQNLMLEVAIAQRNQKEIEHGMANLLYLWDIV